MITRVDGYKLVRHVFEDILTRDLGNIPDFTDCSRSLAGYDKFNWALFQSRYINASMRFGFSRPDASYFGIGIPETASNYPSLIFNETDGLALWVYNTADKGLLDTWAHERNFPHLVNKTLESKTVLLKQARMQIVPNGRPDAVVPLVCPEGNLLDTLKTSLVKKAHAYAKRKYSTWEVTEVSILAGTLTADEIDQLAFEDTAFHLLTKTPEYVKNKGELQYVMQSEGPKKNEFYRLFANDWFSGVSHGYKVYATRIEGELLALTILKESSNGVLYWLSSLVRHSGKAPELRRHFNVIYATVGELLLRYQNHSTQRFYNMGLGNSLLAYKTRDIYDMIMWHPGIESTEN